MHDYKKSLRVGAASRRRVWVVLAPLQDGLRQLTASDACAGAAIVTGAPHVRRVEAWVTVDRATALAVPLAKVPCGVRRDIVRRPMGILARGSRCSTFRNARGLVSRVPRKVASGGAGRVLAATPMGCAAVAILAARRCACGSVIV